MSQKNVEEDRKCDREARRYTETVLEPSIQSLQIQKERRKGGPRVKGAVC